MIFGVPFIEVALLVPRITTISSIEKNILPGFLPTCAVDVERSLAVGIGIDASGNLSIRRSAGSTSKVELGLTDESAS